MTDRRSRYVVVEGPIGVGKTSLARRLAEHYGSDLVLEQAEENPFLERFYRDPRRFALPTQLFFLFQRVRQLQDMRQDDLFAPVRVADFLIEKDALFAELTLDADELALYRQTYEHLARDLAGNVPQPDLVIYLQAPVDVLAARVRKRGIPHEQLIEPAYLERLADSYARFFHHYHASPLLIVNAKDINPIEREADFRQLLRAVENTRSGRHYFNPVPDFA
ncbi:MAG TPA: deoxynucleoside kinase [Gammaproteobacteria bacterium]|nr:deoxynucleoside kinase [Gammaproteobacteria bacterium]